MTPLHLRRRLRAVVTILRGVSPDEAAEARAVYRTAYDCGDDEPIADLMRQAVGQIDHLRTRVDVLKAQLDAMDQAHADTLSAHYRVVGELDGIRAGLCTDGDTRDALRHVSAVLDDAGVSIPNCDRGQGCTSYHLTHRIHALADERDTLRTELAAGASRQAPKRERERLARVWTADYGTGWAIRKALANGPATSRDIATRMWARISATPDESEICNNMRWVQDFARAGYLTVAKGPGGVRVYGLKEGA